MTLDAYLKLAKMNGAEFARRVGYSRMAVSRWRRCIHLPGPDAIEAIRKASQGAVLPADWYPAKEAA